MRWRTTRDRPVNGVRSHHKEPSMRRLHFFLVASAVTVASAPAVAFAADAPIASASPGCQLGNGVQHVIELTFDNVHFFRDNPNVPSDLELMPHLLNFLEGNGALLSN